MTWIEFDGARVARVADGDPVTLAFSELFPDASLMDGAKTPDTIELAFNCYLVEIGRRLFMIDTGVGAGKDRADYPDYHRRPDRFMQQLNRFGIKPGDIDKVVCTHLHPDHVGWNTVDQGGGWVPTFANATYCFPEADFHHLHDRYQRGERDNWQMAAFADSILPIHNAGRCILFGLNFELSEGVVARPFPGHSPGHSAIFLALNSGRLIFCGDVFHHPLQVSHPELRPIYDQDSDKAAESRRLLLAELAREGSILMPSHFAQTDDKA